MNAKARKKMTRKQQRAELQTSTATENAAPDAVPRSAMGLPTSKQQGETKYDYDVRVYDMQLRMPQMFAAVVAQNLRDVGHAPVDEGELDYLARLVDRILLPKAFKQLENGILEKRRLREAGTVVKGTSIDVKFKIHFENGDGEGADTQVAGLPSQDGPQNAAVQPLKSPPEGTQVANTANSNGLPDEEPNELWETALAESRIAGGAEEDIKKRAVKIYRGLKKKLKAKAKKQAVIAA